MSLHITPSERQALQLLAGGHTRTELASDLGMGMVEIELFLTRLFAALGAATQTEAIAVAQKRGLVSGGLLVSKRGQRIDAAGTPAWNETGQSGRRAHQ